MFLTYDVQMSNRNTQDRRTLKSLSRRVMASLAAVLGSSIFFVPSALAEERSCLVNNTSVTWALTPEQCANVDPLLEGLSIKQDTATRKIVSLRHQMDKLFMNPSPARNPILELQSQIDHELEEMRLAQWKVALHVRSLLTPEQRKTLGCLPARRLLMGVSLSPEQMQAYYRVMRPYLMTSLSSGKKLDELKLQKAFLLQEVDLVHGCHSTGLDLKALLANQGQINTVNSEMAMERLRLAITLHGLLTSEQKKTLFTGAAIRIPDPVGVELAQDGSKPIASPEKAYPNVALTETQKNKYKTLMQQQLEATTAYRKMRAAMLNHRSRLLCAEKLNEAELETVQTKINEIDGLNGIQRMITISKLRDVLTNEQRLLVFNRHHPKIWKDTGINEKQDHQIMDIHMKIEEADRTGRQRMSALSSDLLKLYYDAAMNDEQIIAAQKQYNNSQSDMVRAELICLFEGRDVLTVGQRQKLIQLMAADHH